MFSYDFIQCAVVILAIFVIGEIVSAKTKAFVPSVFVAAVLFLLGFWSGVIPKDIIDVSGFSALGISAMLVIVVHMGSMLSPGELLANWKTVLISLGSLCGLIGALMLIGARLLDWNTVIVAIPPLSGGMTAAIIMQNGAADLGLEMLSVLAIVVYVIQGFVGYPLTTVMLKREAKRLMKDYRKEDQTAGPEKNQETSGEKKTAKRLIPPVPEKYRSIYLSLLVVFLSVWVSARLEMLTGKVVSRYVFCLVLGVVFTQIGLLEKNCLNETQGYGVFVTAAMAMVFAGLSSATPEMFKVITGPLIIILLIGVSGLFLMAVAIGRAMKYSWEMSFAISLNALYGFPPNMIITNEAINSVTEDPDVKEYLGTHIMPKMLIGGFTSVTVTSTLLAGIFINLLR